MKLFVRTNIPMIVAPPGVPASTFDFHCDAQGYGFPFGFEIARSYLVRVSLFIFFVLLLLALLTVWAF